MRHVFIVGSKGIPAQYGGYETFVEMLTRNRVSSEISYHVACAVDDDPEEMTFIHNDADCFCIKRRPIGSARAITYDLDALDWCMSYVETNRIDAPIIYVLACRIGPFIKRYVRRLHQYNGALFVNPDGHEWLRAKWSVAVRHYWKFSESGMVKHADLLVCDSKGIESYIHKEYGRFNPKTTYIAYGADTQHSRLDSNSPTFQGWLTRHALKVNEYYLVVGRLVPENNYEIMIREFMSTDSLKDFVLVTDSNDDFLQSLQNSTNYQRDDRIKFVGSIYDQDLLKKVRECAFAYLHGHEVGGTNPSLLEALASTKLNILLDVTFNREVARESALYWTKQDGSLASVLQMAEHLSEADRVRYARASTREITQRFSWAHIVREYENLFLSYERR